MSGYLCYNVYDWAITEATTKKKTDFSKVEFLTYDEGVCVQSMHIGTYDEEPLTIEKMDAFVKEQGYELDMKFSESTKRENELHVL